MEMKWSQNSKTVSKLDYSPQQLVPKSEQDFLIPKLNE